MTFLAGLPQQIWSADGRLVKRHAAEDALKRSLISSSHALIAAPHGLGIAAVHLSAQLFHVVHIGGVRVAECAGNFKHVGLESRQHRLDFALKAFDIQRRFLESVAAHAHHFALSQIARADLDANRNALELPTR